MLHLFATLAYAQQAGGAAPAAPSGIGAFTGFIPLLLILVAFFFLIIWPQQKTQKARKKMLEGIKKGDHVVTRGGIYGTIVGFENNSDLILRIANNVEVKISKSAVEGLKEGSGNQP